MDGELICLIAESLSLVTKGFDRQRFVDETQQQLGDLTLTQRAQVIANEMAGHLPDDFVVASQLLIKSLGPELRQISNNGLAPFFYLPHSHFIATFGSQHSDAGMQACHELTRRFTAEFCIRPFLTTHLKKSLNRTCIFDIQV